MDTILHTDKIWLTKDITHDRLEVYSSKLATKLNKFLKKYDKGDYTFQPGEEAVFRLAPDQTQLILQRFLLKNKAQIACPLLVRG